MKFTPYNIKNQEFNKAVRGYDKDEVHAFLESLSLEFGSLLDENEKLKKQVEILEEQMHEFKKLEKTLQNTLVNAQESTSKAVESARKQNQLIIKEAEVKASQLIEKAKDEADKIREAVFKLREEKALLLAKLKAMIDTQTKVLDMTSEIIETKSSPQKSVDPKSESQSIDVDDILEKLI